MRRLLGNPVIKAFAVVLFIVAFCFLASRLFLFVKSVDLGVFYSDGSFDYTNPEVVSTVCRQYDALEDSLEIALMNYEGGTLEGEIETEISEMIEQTFPVGTNILFVVTDRDENVLYSSYENGRPHVVTLGLDIYNNSGVRYSLYVDVAYPMPEDKADNSNFHLLGEVHMFVADLSNTGVEDELTVLYREYRELYDNKNNLFTEVTVCIAVMLVCAVWLMASAGYSGKEGPAKLRFYDKIPLEIFLGIYIIPGCLCWAGCYYLFYDELTLIAFEHMLIPIAAIVSLLILVLLVSLANRVKTGTFFKNTVCWALLKLLWKVGKAAGRGIVGVAKKTVKLTAYIPLVWKSIVLFVCYAFVSFILLAIGYGEYEPFAVALWFVFNIMVLGLFVWRAVILMCIKKGGERIYCGDYDTKIDTSIMYLEYKKFAEYLNSVGNGLNTAVEERMKSERMKSELITNVSHDLKTPLTSIINYVGLLKNEDRNSPKVDEYIEVLDRQSNRLKKLTEDLIFAAKASSGTERVSLEQINIYEFVGQAIAEYSDKLEQARLSVVPAMKISNTTTAKADGRLLWRIMDNIFGNVYKYAQPGTRVYVEASETEKTVTVSVKNISKEQLNVSVEELMQRFVRGDSSRSSEGSGLGLSISRDLATLQNGLFDISVDGDLFKTSVILRKN